MIVFDVKCDVLAAVVVKDRTGRDITVPPGRYHLMGLDHFVRDAGGGVKVGPMDITLVGDNGTKYLVSSADLGRYISLDQVEVKP